MKTKKMQTLHSSNNEHWNTPEIIIKKILSRFGYIALDPCSNENSIVPAAVSWYGPEAGDKDGLVEDWSNADGLVFVNYPYGRKSRKWTKKVVEEYKKGAEIIILGPSRTDTIWMQEDVLAAATSVVFLRGRLTFLGAPNPAPFPSFLAYYGPNKRKFELAFVDAGVLVK